MEKGENTMDLVLDRDKWQAVVKMVTNFRVSYNAGKFLNLLNNYQFIRK
jgi:hypothetical protein